MRLIEFEANWGTMSCEGQRCCCLGAHAIVLNDEEDARYDQEDPHKLAKLVANVRFWTVLCEKCAKQYQSSQGGNA